MTKSNLKNFDNFYADLAQSAYTGRPSNFPYDSQSDSDKMLLDSGQSLYFNFSQDAKFYNNDTKEWEVTPGGKNFDQDDKSNQDDKINGKVYLQPDPDLHTVEETMDLQVPSPNGGYHKETDVFNRYQKGLLTDEKAGFNAYYLTDTPTLGKDTKQTYLSIRGSDGMRLANWNDWVDNDAQFAINHIHIPQAKLATKGMKVKIAEMSEKAPNAKMDIVAHSLGTMVSVQGIAGLNAQELEKVGKVVLFDGPDTTKSLKKMGLSDEKIKKISEKIEYYVNPFDMVSMLNREHTIAHLPGDSNEPLKKPVGKVNIVVPLYYTQSFDSESAHDFGVFQGDGKGSFLTASADYHPELLRAGEKLARLIAKTLDALRKLGVDEETASNIFNSLMQGDLPDRAVLGYAFYHQFETEYKEIIRVARLESMAWDREAITRYQEQLGNGNLTGEDRILVRARLLQTAAQLAIFEMEDKVKHVQTLLSDAKEFVQNTVKDTSTEAMGMVTYLSGTEVASLLADFNVSRFWDDTIESNTKTSANGFLTEIKQLGMTLVRASGDFAAVDTQQAEDFNNLLADVKGTWRGKNGSDSK
ncbi:cutinase family protein [Streptococcus sanguinis]|uniref:cutinase family protein n=1 Tax=Streptococcus sanguinis TaxID=1305 RepID=UPI002283B6B2|nr:cutinase family protein [Streptococcus sanguinis]MCY7021262.1 cutinase family protein [Streptococcus sanguinis]